MERYWLTTFQLIQISKGNEEVINQVLSRQVLGERKENNGNWKSGGITQKQFDYIRYLEKTTGKHLGIDDEALKEFSLNDAKDLIKEMKGEKETPIQTQNQQTQNQKEEIDNDELPDY